ncbi:cardiolipin synthase [Luteimonas sp. Sa2BVA3]|uniref:Cardiolipin synthase n=1 Tax=Luteimonas colneyensis TaxID=2762230 RepID=A0ABR8UI04_9GAMM|nr:cardiolipin synthase [Luteimonas colneyensis]MBD7987418.1 cardiolipin synthase [Luteimonas colneyensis]
MREAWQALLSIPHLGTWLLALWAAYLLLLGGWIVLQKREPVATLSWLLGLALLPYLGFFVYHVFGPQRIRRQRLRRARSRESMDAGAAFEHAAHADAAELARLAVASTGLAPSTARDVRLLVDGAAKYDALLADIAAATKHVHLEYYIYEPDRTGAALRDALAARARAGVEVRLLVDAIGSARSRRFFQPLLDAGGEVAWFHPMRFGHVWRRPWANLRTHRKIVVIDGRVAYTGGMNVTDEQDERLGDQAYRDLHLRLEGEVVRRLQLVFCEDWAYATGSRDFLSSVARDTPPDTGPGPIRAQVLVSGPDSPWEAIHRMHVSAIHAAKRRVWMTTPYFVPGEAAMMALTSAAAAGLDVRLLVPRESDSKLVTLAARSYFGALLLAGVKIYEYGPRMLHSKSLLVDDELVLVGSANFDHRSFRLNFEVSVLFDDPGIAATLATLLEGELANAPRVQRGRHRPLLRARLPEALARLLSPLL